MNIQSLFLSAGLFLIGSLSSEYVAQKAKVYQTNVVFKPAMKETPEVSLAPKQGSDGKVNTIVLQPAKGMMKALAMGDFKIDTDLSKSAGVDIFRVNTPAAYNLGKETFHGCYLTEAEPGVYVAYHLESTQDAKPTFKVVFAADDATVKAWAGGKGQTFADGLISKMKSSELAGTKARYASVTMPAPGKFHSSETMSKSKDILSNYLAKDGGTIQRVVVISDNWETIRNKATGIVTGRFFNVVIAESHPKHPQGLSMMFVGTIYQDHNGSDFSGNWYTKGVSQNVKYGPYIWNENISK